MLDGRCVVLTGAAGALGSVVRARLERDGAKVFPVDRATADLTDEAQVESAYDAAEKRFGAVYGSVHCAGGWTGGRVAQTTVETFEKMIAVNLRSAFLCCRAALRRMERRGEGRIVNVAAYGPATWSGIGGNAAYAASKVGVIALTKAIAEESAKTAIRANCIAPGMMRTKTNASAMPGADQSGWVPLEDAAEAILYLVSPQSGMVNGAVLTLPSR